MGENSKWLITCDVVCHGVPSPIVWRTYIDSLNDQNISNLRFRDKTKYGYLYSQFKIESLNNSYEGIEQNIMLRAFFLKFVIDHHVIVVNLRRDIEDLILQYGIALM